jgi:murein DD-endopeptidase MepM/ murein hydrolase activator NlpD
MESALAYTAQNMPSTGNYVPPGYAASNNGTFYGASNPNEPWTDISATTINGEGHVDFFDALKKAGLITGKPSENDQASASFVFNIKHLGVLYGGDGKYIAYTTNILDVDPMNPNDLDIATLTTSYYGTSGIGKASENRTSTTSTSVKYQNGNYFVDSGYFQDMMYYLDVNVNLGAFPIDGPQRGPNDRGWKFTSPFGMRLHPIKNEYIMHPGIDIGDNSYDEKTGGSDLVAMYGGTVIETGYDPNGHGYYVIIEAEINGKKVRYRYSHMHNAPNVTNGQEVDAGDKVGIVGSTGSSTGGHLHLEVTDNGTTVNPDSNFTGQQNYNPAKDPTNYIPSPYVRH